jgi:hypothetical protein
VDRFWNQDGMIFMKLATLGFGSFACRLGYTDFGLEKRRSCLGWRDTGTLRRVFGKISLLERKQPLLQLLSVHTKEYDEGYRDVFNEENIQHSQNWRSVRLKLLWRDPEFRAKNLAARRATHVLLKQSVDVRERWKNPHFRQKVCQSLKGRVAWNKGKRLSNETRMRMSVAAKKRHELKRNKQQNYFFNTSAVDEKQQNCELCQVLVQRLERLYKDLKLWSDNFRSKYTRLPRMSDVDKSCAPVLLLKINRYVELKNILKSEPYCQKFENMVVLKEDVEKKQKQIFLDGKEIF